MFNKNKYIMGMRSDNSAIMIPSNEVEIDDIHSTINDMESVNILSHTDSKNFFYLINPDEECLAVPSLEILLKNMNEMSALKPIKIVSIFGKIGDGKSYTLNHSVFDGENTFETSNEQGVCTKGVHAAYHKGKNILCLDTEGMSSSSSQENFKTRILWKILAISDVVIYRSRCEKLQDDMYMFLGNASQAIKKHFSDILFKPKEYDSGGSSMDNSIISNINPSLVIYHETMNTNVIKQTVTQNVDEIIQKKFEERGLELSSFRSLKYFGIQKKSDGSRTYSTSHLIKDTTFKKYLLNELDTQITAKRSILDFYSQIELLTKKFSRKLEICYPPFSLKVLECGVKCKVCQEACQKSSNHEGEKHRNFLKDCFYDQKYENKIRLCKKCYNEKNEEVIVNQTTNAGDDTNSSWLTTLSLNFNDSTINCKNCGVIFRNGWFNSRPSMDSIIHTKVVHVWPGGDFIPKGPSHSGQKVIDGISSLKETVSSYTSEPTKIVSTWLINKVNPSYWRNDNEIRDCKKCKKNFHISGLSKHHCRKCGEGFCNSCSLNRIPVPEYGWTSPSRVCDDCFSILNKKNNANTGTNSNIQVDHSQTSESDTMIRRASEAVFNTIKPASWVVEQSFNYIKYKTQPDYWVPDEKAPDCFKCKLIFGINNDPNVNNLKRHHCRSCGNAFCDNCSKGRIPVPERGWQYDVRVCDKCLQDRKEKQT